MNRSYIELIASSVHPKTVNHLRSHLRAIMALDHHRLISPGKNSGRIFCVQRVYFTKSCQQIWVRVNQPFITFIRHIWGETLLWGTVFIIQTSDNRMQYLTVLQYKLEYSGRSTWSKHAWPLAKPLKKFPKSPIRPTGSDFCSASCGECLNGH